MAAAAILIFGKKHISGTGGPIRRSLRVSSQRRAFGAFFDIAVHLKGEINLLKTPRNEA